MRYSSLAKFIFCYFQMVPLRTSPIRTNLFDRRDSRYLSERGNLRQLRDQIVGRSRLVQTTLGWSPQERKGSDESTNQGLVRSTVCYEWKNYPFANLGIWRGDMLKLRVELFKKLLSQFFRGLFKSGQKYLNLFEN